MYYDVSKAKWRPVLPADVTATLHHAVTFIGPAQLGFLPTDVKAFSLTPGGAMALLCADVDTENIQLLGRWRSNAMLY